MAVRRTSRFRNGIFHSGAPLKHRRPGTKRLGNSLSFVHLLRPGRIGSTDLRNRFVFAPIDTNLGQTDGTVSERLLRHYERRAAGGVGLVITEICVVNPGGAAPHQLRIDDERHVPGLTDLARRIHARGSSCFLQLGHLGGEISSRLTGQQAVAPSAVPSTFSGEVPRALDHAGIAETIAQFSSAASRARAAGCDGVEIHAGHGYLIDQFLSPVTNKRTDEYGGSAGGRYRFLGELMHALRAATGNDFSIIVRISAEEKIPGGLVIQDSVAIARRLEQDGADAIHVSAGSYASLEWTMPPMAFPKGVLVPYAAAIRAEVGVPVIAVGRLGDADLAEDVLAQGKADFIALGRPLLADPDLPNKVATGQQDEIRHCPACNDCLSLTFVQQTSIGCMVNPDLGREGELDYSAALVSRRVLVIGGGPGGMEAARIATLRGHKVTLLEAGPQLGGHLRAGGQVKSKAELKQVLAYLTRQVEKLGIDIRLNTRASRAMVDQLAPEVVIVATGSRPVLPSIEGVEQSHVMYAEDLLEGRHGAQGQVVIVGASGTGCEAAERLLDQGATAITILARGKRYAQSVEPLMRKLVRRDLEERGVQVIRSAEVFRITATHVHCRLADGSEMQLPADAVVIARGYISETALLKSLQGGDYMLHALGDCVEVRRIRTAIYEAAVVATGI